MFSSDWKWSAMLCTTFTLLNGLKKLSVLYLWRISSNMNEIFSAKRSWKRMNKQYVDSVTVRQSVQAWLHFCLAWLLVRQYFAKNAIKPYTIFSVHHATGMGNSVGLLHCFLNFYLLKYFPVSTIFRLDFRTVLTVWDVLFFIRFWNCSDCGMFCFSLDFGTVLTGMFYFSLDFGTVLTVWDVLFFIRFLELFWLGCFVFH